MVPRLSLSLRLLLFRWNFAPRRELTEAHAGLSPASTRVRPIFFVGRRAVFIVSAHTTARMYRSALWSCFI